MPAKKAAKPAAAPKPEPEPATKREPGEINSNLSSDRMKALLKDHRRMGARP